jgi:hypothetical protein
MGCSIICSSVCSVDPMQPRRNLEENNNVCKCSSENTAQCKFPLKCKPVVYQKRLPMLCA